jgi:hypothetical protein
MIPNSNAAWRNEASSSKTPYWRNGSASPRKAEPIALIACSGDVLLKEAKSDESFTKSIENLLKSLPLNPADFPNVANVAAHPMPVALSGLAMRPRHQQISQCHRLCHQITRQPLKLSLINLMQL